MNETNIDADADRDTDSTDAETTADGTDSAGDGRADAVSNRSEIVFVYDARDCNPNGNPLSGANRPRIDPQTSAAIVTDVRLKRYLRDQLEDDGHDIYVTARRDDPETAMTREKLLERCVDASTAEEVTADAHDDFLDAAADVRYFGATLSIDADGDSVAEAVNARLPRQFTGPVQFNPARTLHPVELNEEYNSLTSVIATDDDKEQGGFGLDDHRIKYGLIAFGGVVNENAADDTNLTATDVERLDTLCWRAIKNQTNTRSKVGQDPRLYLRVEYGADDYHIGGLERDLDLGDGSKAVDAIRSIRDLTVDPTALIAMLADSADAIDTVHLLAGRRVTFEIDGETGGEGLLVDAIEDAVGDDTVERINPQRRTAPPAADD